MFSDSNASIFFYGKWKPKDYLNIKKINFIHFPPNQTPQQGCPGGHGMSAFEFHLSPLTFQGAEAAGQAKKSSVRQPAPGF